MECTDRILKCIECGGEFVFSAGEQAFFHEKQFANDPKHCKKCRANHDAKRPRAQIETRVKCSECGAETTVPFKPTQGKPVLCRSCFQKASGAIQMRVGTKHEQSSRTTPGSPKSVIPFPQAKDQDSHLSNHKSR